MKKRLDVLTFEKGLAESREKAKAMIMAGEIFVDGIREDKPGSVFDENAAIEKRGRSLAYVSRGGLKLEKAIEAFGVSADGKICMDVGASTGGFTDCMLQRGAAKVYAVDVGYGQLAWSLRNDPRVVVLEKTNARYLDRSIIPEPVELVSVDVSFISLTLILPAVKGVMAEDAEAVCLIKPQFEAGREKVGKKGVVRDPAVHGEVIEKVVSFAGTIGFDVLGLTFSPVKGPEGNIEYLLRIGCARGEAPQSAVTGQMINNTVSQAHESLAKEAGS